MSEKNKFDIPALLQTFQQNNIQASFVENRKQALQKIIDSVTPGNIIGWGGSRTLEEIGARDYFLQHKDKFTVIDQYEEGIPREESYERRRQSLLSDVFLTSSNAITMNGELINTDGTGNRVAAMIFGPKKVIVVAGINKLVNNAAEGRKRILTYAAPKNSTRLKQGNPCETTGICQNCRLPTAICRAYTVINGQMKSNRLYVIIVNESLGI